MRSYEQGLFSFALWFFFCDISRDGANIRNSCVQPKFRKTSVCDNVILASLPCYGLKLWFIRDVAASRLR